MDNVQTELTSIRSPGDPELFSSGRRGSPPYSIKWWVKAGGGSRSTAPTWMKAETPEAARPRGTEPLEAANHGACLLRPGLILWSHGQAAWVGRRRQPSAILSPPPCSGSCSQAPSRPRRPRLLPDALWLQGFPRHHLPPAAPDEPHPPISSVNPAPGTTGRLCMCT